MKEYQGQIILLAALLAVMTGCAIPGSYLQSWNRGLERNTVAEAGMEGRELERQNLPGEVVHEQVSPFSRGSLWPGENTQNMLFTDSKARAVNDIVTIEVVESSTASKQASTKLGRTSELSAGITGLLGLETKLNARLDRVKASNASGASKAAAVDLANILGASSQSDFNGSGVTTRSGQLSGKMTALVKEVLPNGNLVIEGKRMVSVNGEEQIMVLNGMIRSEDISSSNIVLSTYIAEAKISYYGVGVVGDKQQPGWMVRVFDKVWPF